MEKDQLYFIKLFWKCVAIGIGSFTLLLILINFGALGKMPNWEELENPKAALATEIFSEDGEILGRYFKAENRTTVSLNEIHPVLVSALIATEDARFADHSGIDVRSLARAIVGLGKDGGASTLTQQLAKNLFRGSKFKLLRPIDKLREWIIAIKLERNYTKTEIINLYLNIVPFSDDVYGIKTASQTFFSKTADSLKVEEAAVLIGMLKGPGIYNPRTKPEKAKLRRNTVLSQLVKYNYLKQEEYDKLKDTPIKLKYNKATHNQGLATYFREYLRLDLQKWINDNPKSDGTKYDLYKDGLKVYTTINATMQLYAEEAVAKHLSELQKPFFAQYKNREPFKGREKEFRNIYKGSDRYRRLNELGLDEEKIEYNFHKHIKMKVYSWAGERDTIMTPWDSIIYHRLFLQSGFMAMDPANGHIKAWVGGINHKYFQFDHVNINSRRQIGSTFKPFVYTVAIDNGWSPCYAAPNQQVSFPAYGGWTPKNSDGKYGGFQTLMTGLARSTNCITAFLMKQIGPRPVVEMAHKMGISAQIDPFPSICLGTADISVFEMVGAYSTFANKGFTSKPIFVTRIEDKYGNVIKEFVDQQTEVISDQTAYVMNQMLQGVVKSGTAQRLRNKYKIEGPLAGKTGTTNDHTDAWFIGLTPKLIAGVWTGCDDKFLHFYNMMFGQGASSALPIWAYFFQKVHANPSLKISPNDQFPVPEGELTIEMDCANYRGGTTKATESEIGNGTNVETEDDYNGEEL
jgi:penicillin-binding protein 1A